MKKLCVLIFVLANVSFGQARNYKNKHSIVFPTELEEDERYKVVKEQHRRIANKAILFPQDDYDDDDVVDNETDKVNNMKPNKQRTVAFKEIQHNPEYHRNISNRLEAENNSPAADSEDDVTIDNRFLFRTLSNCKCKFRNRCAKKQNC